MSVESEINKQYQDFFVSIDWVNFKCAADYYLKTAALILIKDIDYVDDGLKLLFRNIQKRLYIGIACEFLLKAIYLKSGYVINKRLTSEMPLGAYPFLISDVDRQCFAMDRTLTFNDLLQKVFKIIDFGESKSAIERGLRIAKVFRNKEGHVVSEAHHYEPKNYRDIEDCLILLYRHVFNEELLISISFGRNEKGQFNIGVLNTV